jgi:hypothetical protein
MFEDIKEQAEQFIYEWNVVVDEDVLENLYANLPRDWGTTKLARWAMSMMPNPLTDGYDTPEFNAREAFYMAVVEITTERMR